MRHTLWGGPSDGIFGLHSWTFTPQTGGVMVSTEESWSGDPVEANTAELQVALDGSLASWLRLFDGAAVHATSGPSHDHNSPATSAAEG